jgi:ABC-type lipoprotein export system ATPase subunit
VLFFVLQAAVGCEIFKQSNKIALVVTIIAGCHAITCVSIFFASFFKKASVARMSSVVLTLGFSVLSSFVGRGIFTSGVNWFLSFIPAISLGRCFYIALQWNHINNAFSTFVASFGLMIVMGIVFAVIGILLHSLINEPDSPLKLRFRGQQNIQAAAPNVDGMNDDVKNEMLTAMRSEDKLIRMIGLNKIYPSSRGGEGKYAVRDLGLSIGAGECLGLLGPNGAGKSTTISMLSGFLVPTSGDVLVNNRSILQSKDEIVKNLGVCPQFDVVWPELTVKDHLLFFARVKGTSRHFEMGRVQKIAEKLDLDGDPFNKASETLSGGMRRRLSIGISLLGDPKIWILDVISFLFDS